MCRKKGARSEASISESKSKEKQRVDNVSWADLSDKASTRLRNIKNKLLSIKNTNFRINSFGRNKSNWTKTYQIGSRLVKFKIDTGADVNCVPLNIVKEMKIKMNSEQNDFPVFDYSNNKVKIFGIVKIKLVAVKFHFERIVDFVVVDSTFKAILGLQTCIELGLIKRLVIESIRFANERDQFVSKHNDVFTGLGKIPGQITIHLQENSKPVVHYRKRFPDTIVKKLKPKLDEMVDKGIISPVSHPTSNLQVVEKSNDDLRICLDPKPLNKCLRREHFLIPTIDNLTSELANKKIFTIGLLKWVLAIRVG
ncbi:uncharacterized protein LOC125777149 [Bactrocera dorsalis]|uniref:Uncharacterized protein LOC125777149 n=1 Tax=Bactrocera dorsalis TaxID=27457 RepID=A0ABM3JDQ6_BACDO|nr:uncharacterized protein LOC125777149 [Bactrocera dorsalis]